MPEPPECHAQAKAVELVATALARRRTLGQVYMGGEHHPTPGETRAARQLIQDLIDAGWTPPETADA